MKSYKAGQIQYNYNPDLSGNVILQYPGGSLVIKGSDFLEFIGEVVRRQRIIELEDMDCTEVLGILK